MAKEILVSYRDTPAAPIAIRYGDYKFEVRHRIDKGPNVWELQRVTANHTLRKLLHTIEAETAMDAAIQGLEYVRTYRDYKNKVYYGLR